jgi:hypothetical protein
LLQQEGNQLLNFLFAKQDPGEAAHLFVIDFNNDGIGFKNGLSNVIRGREPNNPLFRSLGNT